VSLIAVTSPPELTTARSAVAPKFLAIWVAALLASWATLAGFVVLEDPYAFFGSPRLAGFSQHKYEMSEFGRIAKLREVARYRPQAVILGDSQAEGGLRTAKVEALTGERTYNLGFLGARIEETEVAFRHALQVAPVHTAILALDYVAFRGGDERAKLLRQRASRDFPRELRDFADLTLSMRALVAAGRGVLFNKLGVLPSHDQQGNWAVHENIPTNENAQPVANEPPTDSAYQAFDEICGLAAQSHIDLRILVAPVHRSFGLNMASRTIWLERVRAIAARHGFTVVDDGGDAAFNADNRNFFDRGHFTAKAGDLFLEHLFDKHRPAQSNRP
jgi:hypothetical protein